MNKFMYGYNGTYSFTGASFFLHIVSLYTKKGEWKYDYSYVKFYSLIK